MDRKMNVDCPLSSCLRTIQVLQGEIKEFQGFEANLQTNSCFVTSVGDQKPKTKQPKSLLMLLLQSKQKGTGFLIISKATTMFQSFVFGFWSLTDVTKRAIELRKQVYEKIDLIEYSNLFFVHFLTLYVYRQSQVNSEIL